MHLRSPFFALLLGFAVTTPAQSTPTTYYVNALHGDDSAPGTAPARAWRTLAPARQITLGPGDQLLLAGGQIHRGALELRDLSGAAETPAMVASYDPSDGAGANDPAVRAVIDARGHPHALRLVDVRHLIVRDLILQADGGGLTDGSGSADMRCGVVVATSRAGWFGGVTLENLWVRNVFYEDAGFTRHSDEVRTANGTQRYGWGIRFFNTTAGAILRDLVIRNCLIEDTGHTGIKFTAAADGIRNVQVLDNRVQRTGGPGIQLSGVRGGVIRGNHVDRSGDASDSRKWGRGSGLWTWTCTDILIERNRFTNARGPGDSAGCHIDYNCRNVVVQYNVSAGNAGGFCEILGNNYNCAYRYNISLNDGQRRKGRDGAFQEGKILWLSGYVGNQQKPHGPYHSYIYNNTIYLAEEALAQFAIAAHTEGLLIANNIFYLQGLSRRVAGDQSRPEAIATVDPARVVFTHNLYLRADNWPADLGLTDAYPFYGDPDFARAGGANADDYIPQNHALVRDRGIVVSPLPGDPVGLTVGLSVTHDILQRPIVGRPDLGAIEVP